MCLAVVFSPARRYFSSLVLWRNLRLAPERMASHCESIYCRARSDFNFREVVFGLDLASVAGLLPSKVERCSAIGFRDLAEARALGLGSTSGNLTSQLGLCSCVEKRQSAEKSLMSLTEREEGLSRSLERQVREVRDPLISSAKDTLAVLLFFIRSIIGVFSQ